MRIVLLNQFYPPDLAPTGRYLHDLARALVAAGHEVSAIASQHAYGGGGAFAAHEQLDGVTVHRLPGSAFGRGTMPGKLADYALYYGGLAAALARTQRPDLVIALTTPPFIGLLAAWTAQLRGARHAHWVMDLYPDVLRAHGMPDGIRYRALSALARRAFAGASAVITLSPSMAESCRAYAEPATEVLSVPLWLPDELSPWPHADDQPVPLRRERGWSSERLVLLYSGNLGLGHRFEEMLAAAARLGPDGPRWVFAGQGRARPRVERFAAEHPSLPIELIDQVPASRVREHLCSADVHLMSLEPSWEGTLMPSKLQASLAVGKPVLHVGDPRGDLARLIVDHGCGWVAPPNDLDALLAAIASAQDPQQRAACGRAALEAGRSAFDRDRNLAAMLGVLTPR